MPAPPPTGTGTGTEPTVEAVPHGWPSDDPTVRDEEGVLGRRPRRPPREPAPGDDLDDGPAVAVVTEGRDRARQGDGGGPRDLLGGRRPAGVGAIDGSDARWGPRSDSGTDDDADEHSDALDHDEHVDGLDDLDDLAAGVQPAGRVLVVMVIALVLAMLVNADALVERAESKPPGPQRDRALAVWHPVQDVSHVLQLYRIRQLADWAAGDDGDEAPSAAPGRGSRDRSAGSAGTGPGAAGEDSEGGEAPAAPADESALRTPTADEPLRLYVGGDFMAQVFGESLVSASDATRVVDSVLHYESASGLTRADYYDWPGALERDLEEHDAEVVVVMFGANDGQGITLADGTPVPAVSDPRWAPEYRRRVGALMDQLRAPGRMVIWVGQPPMRSPDFAATVRTINEAYAAEAALRPWLTFVDAAAVVGGEGGTYAENVPPAPGSGDEPLVIRQPDGIHLTAEGGDILADHVMALVADRVDLSGREAEPTGD